MKRLLLLAFLLAACQASNKVYWVTGKHIQPAHEVSYGGWNCEKATCMPVTLIKQVEPGYYLDLCSAELGEHTCERSSVEVSKQDYDRYIEGQEYPK